MNRLATAEGLVARGWCIFPVREHSKEPATRSGVYAMQVPDLVQARNWWRKTNWNIGVWTGGSNLVVIDLDVDPAKGPPGISTWFELCAAADYDFEQTYCVVTPKGGLHVYFAVEDGFWYPPSVSRVAPNIDVRSSGSYVLSLNSEVNGVEYEHTCSDQVLSLPDWLGQLIDRPPPDMKWMNRQHDTDLRSTPDGWAVAFGGIANHLATQTQVNVDRNSCLYWAVRAVGDHLWSDDFQEACVLELEDVARGLGLNDREIRDTVRSARRRW